MIRNILDGVGNIIGTLDLPANTPEDVWQAALSPFVTPPPVPTPPKVMESNALSATNSVTTSSANPFPVGGMVKIPTAGKYVVLFSGSIFTGGASAQGEFGIYVDGILVPETRRDISCNLTLLGGLVTVSLNAIGVGTYTGTQLILNGAQMVDIRFKSNNGGTIGFNERTMILMKVE